MDDDEQVQDTRPMPGQVEFSADEEKAMRSRPALPDSDLSRPSLKDLAGPGRRSLKDLGQ